MPPWMARAARIVCWIARGGRARTSRPPGWLAGSPLTPQLMTRAPWPSGLAELRRADAHEQVTAMLRRDPAAHAALDDPGRVARLLDSLREAGAHD
jgi:hypothetical protein